MPIALPPATLCPQCGNREISVICRFCMIDKSKDAGAQVVNEAFRRILRGEAPAATVQEPTT